MATIEETMKALNELIESDGTISIPGLSLEPIVEKYIDAKYGEELAKVEDEEERKNLREKWTKYYTEGDGKTVFEMEIANIKASILAAKDQLQSVISAAASAVASNLVPAVLTVGTATSTANPAYALIENKTKKEQLSAMLKSISSHLINALKSMVAILFPVPDIVLTLIETLKTAKQAVNSIPV